MCKRSLTDRHIQFEMTSVGFHFMSPHHITTTCRPWGCSSSFQLKRRWCDVIKVHRVFPGAGVTKYGCGYKLYILPGLFIIQCCIGSFEAARPPARFPLTAPRFVLNITMSSDNIKMSMNTHQYALQRTQCYICYPCVIAEGPFVHCN